MVPQTIREGTTDSLTVSPSRKEVNAIVEANRILETTPEIRGTHHALSIISMLKYSSEWSKKDLLIAQPALAAYRNIANMESSQEYWENEISSLMGDGDYPYELVNTMVFERLNQTIILDHAYSIVTNLLRTFD